MKRDGMRIFAWALIPLGIAAALASPVYAIRASNIEANAWRERESAVAQREMTTDPRGAYARINRVVEMDKAGLVPASTVVSPWPIAIGGMAITAFGILLLAIRRPARPIDSGTPIQ